MRIIKSAAARCAGAFVTAVVLLSVPLGAAAQTLIGRVEPGSALEVELDRPVTADRLIVELDGVEVVGGFVVRGDRLIVSLPPDLAGNRHDLRVFIRSAEGRDAFGTWLFETRSASRLLFGSVQADTGLRMTEDDTEAFATGNLRLEFDRGDGQARGRVVLSRNADAGRGNQDEVSVTDIFVELRRPVLGQDFYLRFGNSDVVSQTLLLDALSRRGVTLRLADPGGGSDVSLFALGTDTQPDLNNLTGLTDSDARVYGVTTFLRPRAIPGMRVDFAAFTGRALDVTENTAHDTVGYGLSTALPFAEGRGDLTFGVSETDWQNKRGRAIDGTVSWQLAAPGSVQSLAVGVEASKIDVDYFTPLNPSLITGETRVMAWVESINPVWQWRLEASTADTNTNGPANNPVDRLRGISGDLTYDPGDFTGGFLNGTLFFANFGVDWQDRVFTPSGAATPEDNTIKRLSFGMQKVQPRYNWAWSAALFDVKDRADQNADRQSRFVSASLGLTPSKDFSAQAFINIGERKTDSSLFKEAEASLSLTQVFGDGAWEAGLGAGVLMTEDPDLNDGRFATVSLARRLSDKTKLIGRASWGRDSLAPEGVTGQGVSFELFLRTDFSFN